MAAKFEIVIGDTGSQSSVKVNGIDISSSIRAVEVRCEAGKIPTVSLEVIGVHCLTNVKAVLDGVKVSQPFADVTPIGARFRELAPIGSELKPPDNEGDK